jgi:hypothetical protein
MANWILEAKARAEKATPGPWRTRADMGAAANIDSVDDVGVALAQQRTAIAIDPTQQDRIANATFIAAARTDVPRLASALLDAVEALESLTASRMVTSTSSDRQYGKCPSCGTTDHEGGREINRDWHSLNCPIPHARAKLADLLTPKE